MIARRTLILGLAAALGVAGCTRASDTRGAAKGESTMKLTTSDETRTAARRFYDVLNGALRTGDLAALEHVIAADAMDHNPVPGMKPGLAGIAEAFAGFRTVFPDAVFAVEDVVAEGDKAACRIRVRATHRGRFLGVDPTSRQVTWTVIDLLRFADGKLVERWGLADEVGLLRQFGAAPG